ncbi:MAG: VOC family protein [Polyangiales bacterium]
MTNTGVEQLGYLGFGVSDLAAWEKFMTRVLGTELVHRGEDGSMAFRHDDHAQRFFIHPDPSDDLLFVGWQAQNSEALDAIEKRLIAAGVEVKRGSEDLCAQRRVRGLISFVDPAGVPVEVFYGPAMAKEPFRSDYIGSSFVANDLGLGHLVVSTNHRDESRDFYINNLGFKLSDYIICDLGGYHVDVCFLHINPRHHSLAMGGPMPKKIHHFLLQVGSMDDVGLTYDRARDAGVVIEQELGRHPNDRMFSFYAQTPSGFQFEFGWGGREIDDAVWEPTTYNAISEWGHRRPPRRKQERA